MASICMVSLVGVCSALDSRSAPGELDSAVWGSLLEHRRDDFGLKDLSSVCFDVGMDDLETSSILSALVFVERFVSFRCGCGLATYLGLGVSPLSLELSLVVVDLYWSEPCCELNSSFVRIGWRYLCF
ncbi:unnamed protein product, partial [Brassica oleracea var. botrytis]